MICYEDGPFQLMVKIRKLLFLLRLKSLISCFHCTVLWISCAAVILVYAWEVESTLLCLAVSGAVSLLEKFTNQSFDYEEEENE